MCSGVNTKCVNEQVVCALGVNTKCVNEQVVCAQVSIQSV